jgi:hypothetical protein
METVIYVLAMFALVALAAFILKIQTQILRELKRIKIPEHQKIELPKIEFPKVDIPPAKEYKLDLNPVIEAIKNIQVPVPQKTELKEGSNIDTDILQEITSLMRVNQAEFQSGLEAFHKAIDKLLAQIPSGEKELDAQKEFMQKFEAAFVKVQESATEAMKENSLRLQEILAEFLNKEQKNS